VYPGDRVKVAWDAVVMLLVLYTATVVPYVVCFYDEAPQHHVVLDAIVDVCFFIDIILNFFTAIDVGNGVYETDKRIIAKTYLKGWFLIDVVTTVPYQLLEKLTPNDTDPGGVANAKLLRIGRVSRLHRLLRLLKLFQVMRVFRARARVGKMTKGLKLGNAAKQVSNIVIVTLFVNHLVCCFWFL
jgi:hypothetical protein